MLVNIKWHINNMLLYSAMYNMEIYCTSLYCIENPYWTRRPQAFKFYVININIRKLITDTNTKFFFILRIAAMHV